MNLFKITFKDNTTAVVTEARFKLEAFQRQNGANIKKTQKVLEGSKEWNQYNGIKVPQGKQTKPV